MDEGSDINDIPNQNEKMQIEDSDDKSPNMEEMFKKTTETVIEVMKSALKEFEISMTTRMQQIFSKNEDQIKSVNKSLIELEGLLKKNTDGINKRLDALTGAMDSWNRKPVPVVEVVEPVVVTPAPPVIASPPPPVQEVEQVLVDTKTKNVN